MFTYTYTYIYTFFVFMGRYGEVKITHRPFTAETESYATLYAKY